MSTYKKYKFYISLFEKIPEWHKEILITRKNLITRLNISEDECDMRVFHAGNWVPREQIVIEGLNLRLAGFIGNPTGRYNI